MTCRGGTLSRGCTGKQQHTSCIVTCTPVHRDVRRGGKEEEEEEDLPTAAVPATPPPLVVGVVEGERSSKRVKKRDAKPVKAYCRSRSSAIRSTTSALGEIRRCTR